MGKVFIWFNRHSTIQKSRPWPNFLQRIILMVTVQEFRMTHVYQLQRHSEPLMVVRVRTCVDWDPIWERELQFRTEERGEGQWVYGVAMPALPGPGHNPQLRSQRPGTCGRSRSAETPGPGASEKVNIGNLASALQTWEMSQCDNFMFVCFQSLERSDVGLTFFEMYTLIQSYKTTRCPVGQKSVCV